MKLRSWQKYRQNRSDIGSFIIWPVADGIAN